MPSFLYNLPLSSIHLLFPSLQILWKVDTILFCLLVLQGLVDSQGRVWRNHPNQLYAIEVTLPEQPEQQVYMGRLQLCVCCAKLYNGGHRPLVLTSNFSPQDVQRTISENYTLVLLELLPSVECLSPRQAIQQMKAGREGENS